LLEGLEAKKGDMRKAMGSTENGSEWYETVTALSILLL
jgi:hypothetical protein